MELAELLVGQRGQDHSAQEQELGEGENLVGRDARGQLLKSRLQVEQQQAGNAQCGGNPEMLVADQRADQERGQAGHLRGDTGGFSGGKLVPVRQEQKSGDHQKADHQRQQLRA